MFNNSGPLPEVKREEKGLYPYFLTTLLLTCHPFPYSLWPLSTCFLNFHYPHLASLFAVKGRALYRSDLLNHPQTQCLEPIRTRHLGGMPDGGQKGHPKQQRSSHGGGERVPIWGSSWFATWSVQTVLSCLIDESTPQMIGLRCFHVRTKNHHT